MRDWDRFFIERARHNASMGTCLTRQVGAVAYRERRSFADAFNGNLPGQQHCVDGGCERCATRGRAFGPRDADLATLSRCVCVHAEQALVGFCARNGIPLDRATVALTTHPCLDCLKLLGSAGVVEILYDEPYALDVPITHGILLRRYDAATRI